MHACISRKPRQIRSGSSATFRLTLRQAALVAGFAYLLNPVSYAEFAIYPRLAAGSPQQTVANLAAHQGLFLFAIFSYLINFLEDIVIAWALYVLLAPVNRALSLLAAWFRLMYTAVALVGMFNLVTVYRMIATPAYRLSFGPQAFTAQIDLLLHSFRYDYAFSIATIFSIHLVLVGYLITRSRYIPWWLGAILIVDGLGWIVNNLHPYLYPQANIGWLFVTSLGELVFALWLLVMGWRIRQPASAPASP